MSVLLFLAAALAQRPTEGGLYAFDDTDVVVSLDDPSGRVRVHYSIEGPNVTKSTDVDEDGTWDFPEDVAVSSAEVLDFYESIGLRPPVSEADMGLGDLGGSGAFDFYLVDFGGDADGYFGIDDCSDDPYHCSGFMVMENDFKGYGYTNLGVAVRVLTSHELFHGVQGAYDAGRPNWFSEGTAVWGEQQFDPDSDDFRYFADAYLEDAGRSLDRPPTGPVPAFAYGTALFWDFLTLRHDVALMNEILEGTETLDGAEDGTVEVVDEALQARGDSLTEAWSDFVRWNLATGDRAGIVESYPYAARLDGILAEAEGASIDDDNRFYPLAATYYRLDHAGGELLFGTAEEGSAVRFSLWPVDGGDEDGPVGELVGEWTGDPGVVQSLGELPAGGYWLIGTYPEIAAESTKIRFCLGDAALVATCVPEEGDSGDSGGDGGEDEEPRKGCGCEAAPSGGLALGVVLVFAVTASRRASGRQTPSPSR